jgi:hypothetical protein
VSTEAYFPGTNNRNIAIYRAVLNFINENKNYLNFIDLQIYIPDSMLLFDNLSFSKGFYKEPDLNYYEKK